MHVNPQPTEHYGLAQPTSNVLTCSLQVSQITHGVRWSLSVMSPRKAHTRARSLHTIGFIQSTNKVHEVIMQVQDCGLNDVLLRDYLGFLPDRQSRSQASGQIRYGGRGVEVAKSG